MVQSFAVEEWRNAMVNGGGHRERAMNARQDFVLASSRVVLARQNFWQHVRHFVTETLSKDACASVEIECAVEYWCKGKDSQEQVKKAQLGRLLKS